jgi:hypothetical protein
MSELRRSSGVAPADPKTVGTDADETIMRHRRDLKKQYLAAPPGPEGDAARAQVEKAAAQLEKLDSLSREYRRVRDLREQARSQSGGAQSSSSPSKPSGSGGTIPPVPGPRRPQQ